MALLLAACGGARSPLRGYRVLVPARDSLSEALAKALGEKGFTVRREVSGGSPPTAALVTFTFRDSTTTWFAARLADTRTGVIVAAVSLPVDSLGRTSAGQARMLADSIAALLAQPTPAAP